MCQIPEAARDKKLLRTEVLFAQYCCRELIVGGVFCRSEFFVECFRAECFLEARQFL